MKKTRWLINCLLLAALAGIAFGMREIARPTTLTICDMMIESATSPRPNWRMHRGAIVIAHGVLHGYSYPGAQLGFTCACKGGMAFAGVDGPPFWMRGSSHWDKLQPVLATEASVPVTLIARVEGESQGCFAPPMTLQAIYVRFEGPVTVTR